MIDFDKIIIWLKFALKLNFLLFFVSCSSNTVPGIKERKESIPEDAVKITEETDNFPPIVQSEEWEQPVPMEGSVNTAGAEDSPFITSDGNTFFFFFTPDVDVPPDKQLIDSVTGIWWCKKSSGTWSEPERIILNNDVSLDGSPFLIGDTLWFSSVRAGNYGEVDIYTAKLQNGEWTDVENAGEKLNKDYDIGELHITANNKMMYYGHQGENGKDIWMLENINGEWKNPLPVSSINTDQYNEDQPFITEDEKELWFTSESRLGYPGPAVFRSLKQEDGTWGEPEEIISQFAGEPTLDKEGNIYFVHHFFSKDMKMIEADIYVARKKK